MKKFISGILVGIMIMTSTFVFAQSIDAIFGQVKLVVDGKAVDKETLLYNGTTYVPLRAAAEVLGKEVAYDDSTKTAYIDAVGTGRTFESSSETLTSLDKTLKYTQYVLDIYKEYNISMDNINSQLDKLVDDMSLNSDKSWVAETRTYISSHMATSDKIINYNIDDVPTEYREAHKLHIESAEDFKKSMLYFSEYLDSLDLNKLKTAVELLSSGREKSQLFKEVFEKINV